MAWARNMKLESVNVVVKYDPKVDFNDDPCKRARKYGIAVIVTAGERVH